VKARPADVQRPRVPKWPWFGPVPSVRLIGILKQGVVVIAAAEVIAADGAAGGKVWRRDNIGSIGCTRARTRLLRPEYKVKGGPLMRVVIFRIAIRK